MIQWIRTMVDTDQKATLAQLEALQPGDTECIDLMTHLLGARQIWLARFEGRPTSSINIFQKNRSLEDCRQMAAENAAAWSAYLNRIGDAELAGELKYKGIDGSSYSTTLVAAITHVCTHGFHHRGQINRLIRQAGRKPPTIDFVAFHRNIL